MKANNKSIERGVGFGITTAVITTLGMIVGLDAVTHSFKAVIGGIIIIAIADGFSDALGMHVSEESQKGIRKNELWVATIATFLSKLILGSTFVIPFLFLGLTTAVYVSIAWGLLVLIVYNYRLAKIKNTNPYGVIAQHVLIAILVIIVTRYLGYIVNLIS